MFASVPEPGYPAYAFAHRNGRVYAGTYTNPQGDSQRSRVFEWTRGGTLLRSWTVPGQDLGADRGVQVANADARGRLVLLEKSRSAVMTLDVETGKFRRWATLPDLPTCAGGETPCSPNVVDAPAIPNYATWGPRGELYVTDYGQAVIWKIPRGTHQPRVWFSSAQLDGTEFGTTGIAYRPGRKDLLITQQSTALDGSVPVDGKLYRLPVKASGRPGTLETLWTSLPGDLPDGFGIARSGRIYVANAGLSQQLVVLSASGEEVERFPEVPGPGDNGSPIPFDTPPTPPSSARGCWWPTSPSPATAPTTRSSTCTSASAAGRRTSRRRRTGADLTLVRALVVQPAQRCLDDRVLPGRDVAGSQPDSLVHGELVVGQVAAG